MNERPIEELIGWVERPWIVPTTASFRRSPSDWISERRVDGSYLVSDRAEVDDLAAWLASRGHAWTLADALLAGAQAYVRTDLDFPPDAIRDALIAAVRKVADQ